MAKKISLSEAVAQRRFETTVRRRSTANLSRVRRRALAPRPPTGVALRYTRALRAVIADIRKLTERHLIAHLSELIPQSGVVESTPSHRTDALNERWARRLAALEIAISERVSERRLGGIIRTAAEDTEKHSRKELSRVLQIDLRNESLGLGGYIADFTQKNVRLIQSVANSQLSRMEEIIAESTAGQLRVEVLRDKLMGTFNLSESRAALIARDQTLKANANLTQLRQQQLGVTEYIWSTSNDERVRGRPGGKWEESDRDHWVLDGTRQTWLNPPVINPVTGERAHPGEDFQCRCVALPVVDQLLRG